MDNLRFTEACRLIIERERQTNGIGTLGEKTLHAVLKHYYEPHPENHEIKVGGYVADIVGEDGIIEIQTRSFERLPRKLDAFLAACPVTIIYPIPHLKWISWIDMETGETTPRRRSPKVGAFWDSFRELSKIRAYLSHPNLSVRLLLVDLEEYRYLNGWSRDKKRGSSRCDRIPSEAAEELLLTRPSDYLALLPSSLPDPFTVKDLMKAAKLSQKAAQCGVYLLKGLNLITHVGKVGRAYLYQINREGTE